MTDIIALLQQERELTERAHRPPRGLAAQQEFITQLALDCADVDQAIVDWLTAHIPRSLLVEAVEETAGTEDFDHDFNVLMDGLLVELKGDEPNE